MGGGAGGGGSGALDAAPRTAAHGLNPIWLAQSKLRRRRFDECIDICGDVLAANPYDQVRGKRRAQGTARAAAAARCAWTLSAAAHEIQNRRRPGTSSAVR